MYQKIKDPADIKLLHHGLLLAQYPIDGAMGREKMDIDLSDPEAFLLYEVCAVEGERIKLRAADASALDCDGVPSAKHGQVAVQLEVKVLDASQLIGDGNWWIQA